MDLYLNKFHINEEVYLKNKENYSKDITSLGLKEPYKVVDIYMSKSDLEIYDENMKGMPLYELVDKFNRPAPFYVYEYELEK